MTAAADAAREVRLDLPVPTVHEPICEVLMRLRLSRRPVPGKAGGGVGFAGPDRNGLSVQLGLLPDGTAGLVMADDAGMAAGPSVSVLWQANQWYWLRARHAPSAIFGHPDLLVRLWPADGETAEPEAWTGYWDYHPRLGFSAGPVGIRAPASSAQTELECDYFLLKATGLTPVAVRLPVSKPDRPELGGASVFASAGFRFELEGRPHAVYVVESSADLLSWASALAVTDQAGKWQFQEQGFGGTGSAFFRARVHD